MGDPLWYYKVLGLHCDGANGSTTFTDVGPSPKTVTANGNAQISTAQYPALTGKTASCYLDGSGDYLSIPTSSAFALGTGDFTIRCRLYLVSNAVSGGTTIFDFRASTSASPFTVYIKNTGTGNFFGIYTSLGTASMEWDGALSLNTWYDLDVVRVSGSWAFRLNGTARSFTTGNATSADGNLGSSSNKLNIGCAADGYTAALNAYFSEVEIYKGVALHTSNFTPATAPFADEYVSISGTTKDSSGSFASRLVRVYRRDTGALAGEVVSNESTGAYKVIAANSGTTTPLKHFAVCYDPSVFFLYRVLGLHCDGTNGSTTFTDVCGKTVTANGNAQISTAQYPALTGKTSSAYFDGSGDYLSIPDSANWDFGTGDFAVRVRARFSSHTTNQTLVGNYQNSTTGWSLQRRSDTNTLRLTLGDTAAIDVSWTPSDGVWYLIEAMRIGTSLSIRVDGTQVGSSVTNSTNISGSANPLLIGALYAGSYIYFFDGYLSELEIIKGYVFSVSDYTPSTDPFVNSTTATENAIIYDDLTPT